MERAFGLIKNVGELPQKRTLPKFGYCYMTFRCRGGNGQEKTFEVSDISLVGMQLLMRDGAHKLEKDQEIFGELHLPGEMINLNGKVAWAKENRLGVRFSPSEENKGVRDVLGAKATARRLRPVHELQKADFLTHNPVGLKYWLHADGPVEIFFWQYLDGEWKTIQVIFMDNFFEWEDGKGPITGRTLSKRDFDTPLVQADEFVFGVDTQLDLTRAEKIVELVKGIGEDLLPLEARDFLLRQLP